MRVPYELGAKLQQGGYRIHRGMTVNDVEREVRHFTDTHNLVITAIRVHPQTGRNAGSLLVTFKTAAMATTAAQAMSAANKFTGQQLLDGWQEKAALEGWRAQLQRQRQDQFSSRATGQRDGGRGNGAGAGAWAGAGVGAGAGAGASQRTTSWEASPRGVQFDNPQMNGSSRPPTPPPPGAGKSGPNVAMLEAQVATQTLATRQLQTDLQGVTQTLSKRIQEQERATTQQMARSRVMEERTEALSRRVSAIEVTMRGQDEEIQKLSAEREERRKEREAKNKTSTQGGKGK